MNEPTSPCVKLITCVGHLETAAQGSTGVAKGLVAPVYLLVIAVSIFQVPRKQPGITGDNAYPELFLDRLVPVQFITVISS